MGNFGLQEHCIRAVRPFLLAISLVAGWMGSSNTAFGQQPQRGDSVSVQIAAQQYEDGKPDKSRLFIFYFHYSGRDAYGQGFCDAISITVNNLSCEKNSIGEGSGFWLKPEYANPQYNGRDGFICKFAKTGEKTAELTVEEKDPFMTFTHRLKLARDGSSSSYFLSDYRASLIKSSAITNQIESVEYRPIMSKGDSGWNAGWENVPMGCNKMTVPVIDRSRLKPKSR